MPESISSDLKEKVRRLPDKPGVYLMKDRLGSVIYVGKAKNLKKRVSSYFQASKRFTHQPKIRALVQMIRDFEYIEVKSEPEALLLEGKLIKKWKPKYNTDFVDDKRFLLVRVDVTRELPRFALARFKKEDGARYFGPFAHANHIRKTLTEMRRRFGILLGDASPKKEDENRFRLYDDVRSEIYGHENLVTLEEYQERVEQACEFLQGKSKEWLDELKQEMVKEAAERNYEKAAALRDIVFALEASLKKTRKFERDLPVRESADETLESLQKELSMRNPPNVIECFDISHISGTFVVASMVQFVGGKPNKAGYRRFKIKSFEGNDDFRSMEEVVGRRYRRLHKEGKPFPDLIVIDGGMGQVGAAIKSFLLQDLDPPELIGLAKKHETIIFPDERPPLRLPLKHSGLQLLQRCRDEAHRFANTFNADLRSKRIRESILDDFTGLGPKKKNALLDEFGSIERLKSASLTELRSVDGIGLETATRLKAFLEEHYRG
ncbi:excinuclease ABC subunit UvrC [Pelagicoccus sp. NFK12]|uniref:Excinuclease ABC subunit UvrC n=1 Tax=Pelagicoccus enzymogenes TaxID=2773457 RepID=A0A927IIY8_9BACT|nr:excinuclease ABC subunit UvrC [Pelagicoccus enzymogenes]MBD5780990.1 excinuclease ABC subunit UvrC [Pelagicoccus enzymogenes]MDQ8198679.1 excinuclease ABC subunit UvrC [Pelagicoccus enzymogenes]